MTARAHCRTVRTHGHAYHQQPPARTTSGRRRREWGSELYRIATDQFERAAALLDLDPSSARASASRAARSP